MADTSSRGNAEISCLGRIEGTRSVDEYAVIVMYDVVIPTSDLVNGSKEILCALAYAPDYDEDPFVPGFYWISVKVCFRVCLVCLFSNATIYTRWSMFGRDLHCQPLYETEASFS